MLTVSGSSHRVSLLAVDYSRSISMCTELEVRGPLPEALLDDPDCSDQQLIDARAGHVCDWTAAAKL